MLTWQGLFMWCRMNSRVQNLTTTRLCLRRGDGVPELFSASASLAYCQRLNNCWHRINLEFLALLQNLPYGLSVVVNFRRNTETIREALPVVIQTRDLSAFTRAIAQDDVRALVCLILSC